MVAFGRSVATMVAVGIEVGAVVAEAGASLGSRAWI
jgi:hypothetical protein